MQEYLWAKELRENNTVVACVCVGVGVGVCVEAEGGSQQHFRTQTFCPTNQSACQSWASLHGQQTSPIRT